MLQGACGTPPPCRSAVSNQQRPTRLLAETSPWIRFSKPRRRASAPSASSQCLVACSKNSLNASHRRPLERVSNGAHGLPRFRFGGGAFAGASSPASLATAGPLGAASASTGWSGLNTVCSSAASLRTRYSSWSITSFQQGKSHISKHCQALPTFYKPT